MWFLKGSRKNLVFSSQQSHFIPKSKFFSDFFVIIYFVYCRRCYNWSVSLIEWVWGGGAQNQIDTPVSGLKEKLIWNMRVFSISLSAAQEIWNQGTLGVPTLTRTHFVVVPLRRGPPLLYLKIKATLSILK